MINLENQYSVHVKLYFFFGQILVLLSLCMTNNSEKEIL